LFPDQHIIFKKMRTSGILRAELILILILTSFISCENNGALNVDCNECYGTEPDSGDLIIYLTIEDPYLKVPLTIYKDQVDDEYIEYQDTAYSSPYYLYVDLNEYYSVKAEYSIGTKTVYAVDGDKIKTRFVTETCDYDCWVITGGIIDVKLKKF
jgi:hypothetical protein